VTDLPTPDLPADVNFVPALLGVRARLVGGELVLDLHPTPAILHHGVIRASVLAYVVDAIAGLNIDGAPDTWSFTTDLSIRTVPLVEAGVVTATHRVLREGRRSVTCDVDMTTSVDGAEARVGAGSIGFARVPIRPGDPDKFVVTPEMAPGLFEHLPFLDRPVREAAGVVAVDPAAGVLEMAVRPDVQNPAGTLQGGMVALLVESAAEEFAAAATGRPMVVVDLDIRFLTAARVGPVRSEARLLGPSPTDAIEVRLHDTSNGHLTTLAYARAVHV